MFTQYKLGVKYRILGLNKDIGQFVLTIYIYYFELGVMHMKKTKYFLLLTAFLLICMGIYFLMNQKTVNEAIDQSISDHHEPLPVENEIDEDDSASTNEEEDPEEVEVSDKVVHVLKNTVDFFFKREFHIVAIGDSLTQGVGDETKNGGYIGMLDDTINHNSEVVTFENFGKRGNRTDQLMKRLDEPEIIEAIETADIVLMTIGANDIMQVAKENFTNLTYPLFVEEQIEFEKRLHDIFQKIETLNTDAHIYLLGLYNPFEKYFQDIEELDLIVNSWNQTSYETTLVYDEATFIPIKDLFDETDINLFAEDNFHPNINGYQKMAKRVLSYLTDKAER